MAKAAAVPVNTIICGDCVQELARIPEESVDLIFADPPFNIGYRYDGYDDRKDYDEYVGWTRSWMAACLRVLKRSGSFYVAIGDEFAAEVRLIGRDLGLYLRNWIIWAYSFGQNARTKFARSHTHILYFVKNRKSFVFNDLDVRVPSARHTEYSDRRADPDGRVPDDTWTEFPRVCGTFNERQGWHGCQMPVSLLRRIVRASSRPRDLVLDPFAGSGTTLVAAAQLGRRYLGIELSPTYAEQARRRLAEVPKIHEPAPGLDGWTRLQAEELASLYRETSTVRANLVANEVALDCFTRLLNHRLGTRFAPQQVAEALQRLERRGTLPRLRNDRPYRPRQSRRTDTPDRSVHSTEDAIIPGLCV